MDLEIQDRAFLITGGTDGLGLALAQRLVAEGALVAVCGRDEERLARAQVLLGLDALCSKTDVTNAEQLDEFI
ncbi:MAG TPA: SDR family NAD(P)-dependent oxidoreductase, partial [Acidimicrobiales bacterium]